MCIRDGQVPNIGDKGCIGCNHDYLIHYHDLGELVKMGETVSLLQDGPKNAQHSQRVVGLAISQHYDIFIKWVVFLVHPVWLDVPGPLESGVGGGGG